MGGFSFFIYFFKCNAGGVKEDERKWWGLFGILHIVAVCAGTNSLIWLLKVMGRELWGQLSRTSKRFTESTRMGSDLVSGGLNLVFAILHCPFRANKSACVDEFGLGFDSPTIFSSEFATEVQ